MPDDIEARVDSFVRWASDNVRGDVEPDVISSILQMRSDYFGEDAWRPGVLREVLLDLFPRMVRADTDYIAAVGPTVSAYVDFLRASGERASADVLAAEMGDVLPQFPRAMADRSRWGMAKSLFSGKLESGVDVQDDAAVESWVREFNERPYAERLAATESAFPLPEVPPVRVPARPELAAVARTADHMVALRRLVDWLGDRREVTRVGWPRVKDAVDLALHLGLIDENQVATTELMGGFHKAIDVPGITTVWNLALTGGVVTTSKTRAYPGPTAEGLRADADDDAVLSAFDNVFGAATLLEPEHVDQVPGVVIRHVSGVLAATYMGEMTRAELQEGIVQAAREKYERDWNEHREERPRIGAADVAGVLDSLAHMEAERLDDLLEWLSGFGILSLDTDTVELTGLGRWAVSVELTANGISAPIVDPLASASAADLLAWLAVFDSDSAAEERDAWIAAASDPSDAAREILVAASTAEPAARLMAIDVLTSIGEPAAGPLKERLDDPEIWRHAAQTLELIGAPSPRRLTDPDRIWMMIEGMTVALAEDDTAEAALPTDDADETEQLFDVMARSEHPATADVLEQVGRSHSDRRIARAARKAAFKARSRTRHK